MENFKVKDTNLAEKGNLQLEWAQRHMPVINQISKDSPKKNR
jgi:S-adenosylhomocysteine hydrolase